MNAKTTAMRTTASTADSLSVDECKEMALKLDFPGEIKEALIKRVVEGFLNERDLLADFKPLKKHIRYVFGKRVTRMRNVVRRGTLWLEIWYYPEPQRRSAIVFEIELPYRTVEMFKRMQPHT